MNPPDPLRMDRRAAVKWLLTALASTALLDRAGAAPSHLGHADGGYGTDPDLLKDYRPGDLWPLTFSAEQHRAAVALCDAIIPAEGPAPGAAAVGVPDFIDEWISAPYPAHAADRATIVTGLAWLDAESVRRFGTGFAALVQRQKTAICDDICHVATARAEFKTAADFFKRYRDLTAGGFYTTREGMQDIGYVGNVPLAAFDGPPPAVLRQLGLPVPAVERASRPA